ncbi:MAG: hypothetical protein GX491_10430 [Chloroflexi bacterium]|mgnify:CR=1 FL=1|nr:hypothetical protein [Chloroflexota bacterium]
MDSDSIRTMEGDTIQSPALPKIKIKISNNWIYIAKMQLLMDHDRCSEQFVLLDTNSTGHVTHLLLVQFEGFIGFNRTYTELTGPTVRMGGQDYVSMVSAFDVHQLFNEHPLHEISPVFDHIGRRGYTIAGMMVMQRFARIVDESRRNLIYIDYLERADGSVPVETLISDEAARQALLARAQKQFTILE